MLQWLTECSVDTIEQIYTQPEWYRTHLYSVLMVSLTMHPIPIIYILNTGQAHILLRLTPGLFPHAQWRGRGLIRAFFSTLSPSSLASYLSLRLAFVVFLSRLSCPLYRCLSLRLLLLYLLLYLLLPLLLLLLPHMWPSFWFRHVPLLLSYSVICAVLSQALEVKVSLLKVG